MTRAFKAKTAVFIAASLASLASRVAAQPLGASPEAAFDVRALQTHLDKRVALDLHPSVIVAWIEPGGRKLMRAGTLAYGDDRKPGPRTLFEIGAATDAFTVSAVAVRVQQKALSWNSRLASYLPADASPPEFRGVPIELRHLASHTSNLPPRPLNLNPADERNPFADYSKADLTVLLQGIAELNWRPGARYERSFTGMGALGIVLENRTGADDYEAALRTTLLEPLGLRDTVVALDDTAAETFAPGHQGITAMPPWEWAALAGAGGVKTSAADLLSFLDAHLGTTPHALTSALQTTHLEIVPTDREDTVGALGWLLTKIGPRQLFWSSGRTGGHAAFFGFDRLNARAAVVLANSAASVEDIGFHVLAPDRYPLPQLPGTVSVDSATLARYAGKYEVTGGARITIFRRDDRLFAQFDDGITYRLYALSHRAFRFPIGDTLLEFPDEPGRPSARNSDAPVPKASHLTLRRLTRVVLAKRVD